MTTSPLLTAELRARIEAWRRDDPDTDTRAELARLVATCDQGGAEGAGAAAELDERFAGRLAFGTAGLRAEIGAGPMRMNRVVVRQAAAGLVRWLGRNATIVIGYDARHKSDLFALDTARVVAGAGGRALLLPRIVPTPLLAFAIRHLGTDAGVMCTASHNPPRDNGYKVYLGDGAQIIPPVDQEIAAAIDEVAASGDIPLAPEDDPAIEWLDGSTIEAYTVHALEHAYDTPRDLTIVYTPMHGVGRDVAVDVLRRAGFVDVHTVAAQGDPDPDFPTVAFPNPEEPGALDLAIDDARRLDADVVIANDPDADRLGVVVPAASWDEGARATGWRQLTGNEIGALLGEHVLTTTSGDERLVVTTFVSSGLLARMAEHHGVHFAEVLTGFKWVVRPGMSDPARRFVFGYEEALGFSVDAYVRDKDGITAGLAFAELIAGLRAEGQSVWEQLEVLSRRHGHHAARTWSVRFDDADPHRSMSAVMERLRHTPPPSLADRPVESMTDMARGDGSLPPTDAVVLHLAGGARVIARPSGTEPKVKFYLEVVVPVTGTYPEARARGEHQLQALQEALADRLELGSRAP